MVMLLQQVMPEGITLEMLDAVTDEMRADEDTPNGILVHTHFEQDGRVHIVDVWESQKAYDSFRESRLMPAMHDVAERSGMQGRPRLTVGHTAEGRHHGEQLPSSSPGDVPRPTA
jgi:quinol monooxygenase YgiN